jgi:kynurenine formamidase
MCSPEVLAKVNAAIRRGGKVDRRRFLAASGALAATGALTPVLARAQDATPVAEAATPVATGATISFSNVASLSYSNSPATPLWPGSPIFEAETVVTIENDGFYANVITYHEHTGTHMDSPAHFFADGLTADLLSPASLVAPLAVIDITAQAEADVDYALTVDDILAWESEYGPLPAGALVAMYSGWGARFDDAEAFVNQDAEGVMHYPGFSPDASAFLVAERTINGIASDTLSQDPGNSTDFGTHINILGAGLYGIEGMANLDTIPASGAWVTVGAPNHVNASGGPARILALY